MLTGGSIIQIFSPREEDHIKFIVRIPNRDGVVDKYQRNLDQMLKRITIPEAEAHHKIPLSMNRYGMHWAGDDKYHVVGQISYGVFGNFYQIATKSDGQLFAAKELAKRHFMMNGILDQKINNELQIMKSISHPNVVQYVDYQDKDQYLYIIMEFVPGGNLQRYLNNYGNLTEPLAKRMSAQVFNALSYLHEKKITHRNIKPGNILLADLDSASFTVKLSDFSLSEVMRSDGTLLTGFCGTLLYCAPEVYPQYDEQIPRQSRKRVRRGISMGPQKLHGYSQSVDIWSYGATLWFALSLQPPFEGVADATGDGMFNNIMTTVLDPTVLYRKRVSQEAIALLLEMLNTDPSARPSPGYCLHHGWFGERKPAAEAAARIAEQDGLHVTAGENGQPSFAELSLDTGTGFEDSRAGELDFHSGVMENAVVNIAKNTTMTTPRGDFRSSGGDPKTKSHFKNGITRTPNETFSLGESFSKSGPNSWSQISESVPGLTHALTGPSERYDWELSRENDADSIRTDDENNDLDLDDRRTYSDIFVSELKTGLEKVLRSKHCDQQGRARMSAALPDLLKAYALSLARRARPGIEKQMVVFIRHMRVYVTRSGRLQFLRGS